MSEEDTAYHNFALNEKRFREAAAKERRRELWQIGVATLVFVLVSLLVKVELGGLMLVAVLLSSLLTLIYAPFVEEKNSLILAMRASYGLKTTACFVTVAAWIQMPNPLRELSMNSRLHILIALCIVLSVIHGVLQDIWVGKRWGSRISRWFKHKK